MESGLLAGTFRAPRSHPNDVRDGAQALKYTTRIWETPCIKLTFVSAVEGTRVCQWKESVMRTTEAMLVNIAIGTQALQLACLSQHCTHASFPRSLSQYFLSAVTFG